MATERQTAKIRALKPTGSRIWIFGSNGAEKYTKSDSSFIARPKLVRSAISRVTEINAKLIAEHWDDRSPFHQQKLLRSSKEAAFALHHVILFKYIGENTDGRGFVCGLSQVIDPAGKAIVIFGVGGAARTVSVELALAGASRIFVVNRGQERGQQLVTLLLEKTLAAELSPKPRELPA